MKKEDLPKKIAVFPLSNFIVFPKTTVPLNIFEPRYIDMIQDCMKSNKLIGMIQPKILRNENLDVVYMPNPSLDDLSILVSDIDGWLIRSGTKVTKELLENANNLQIIGRAGVGTDNINIDFATSRGVVVMNVPDGNTISAAEHTMALLMSLSRNVYLGHAGLMKGQWNRNSLVGNELQNKILGVVGLGKIGMEVIKIALSYNMKKHG